MNEILIVDDTPENLSVLRQILSSEGYIVRPALSGEIALRAVESDIPDLILLDIMMPGMDGYEVCEKLKSNEKTRDVPIIFISALNKTEDKVKGFETGGVDYISKPFHTEEVLARVKTHMTLRNMHIQLQNEIKERKLAEKALQKAHDELEERVEDRTAQLNQKTQRLEETNIALKVLLEKREDDKKEFEENITYNIEKLVIPYLEELKMRCSDDSQKTFVGIVKSNLDEITSSFAHNSKDYFLNLTPTQIQIADLIKQGQTTKEIASLLNLSPSTVACHRQEIRKRLALTNKKVNLQAALAAKS